jgi:hypothetical protein
MKPEYWIIRVVDIDGEEWLSVMERCRSLSKARRLARERLQTFDWHTYRIVLAHPMGRDITALQAGEVQA